jgi:hypothetical protein
MFVLPSVRTGVPHGEGRLAALGPAGRADSSWAHTNTGANITKTMAAQCLAVIVFSFLSFRQK